MHALKLGDKGSICDKIHKAKVGFKINVNCFVVSFFNKIPKTTKCSIFLKRSNDCEEIASHLFFLFKLSFPCSSFSADQGPNLCLITLHYFSISVPAFTPFTITTSTVAVHSRWPLEVSTLQPPKLFSLTQVKNYFIINPLEKNFFLNPNVSLS